MTTGANKPLVAPFSLKVYRACIPRERSCKSWAKAREPGSVRRKPVLNKGDDKQRQ